MARGEREVKVTVLGEDRGGKKVLKDIGDQADHTDSRMGSLGDGIKKFGAVAATGFLAAGAGVAVFAKSAFDAGSDAAETLSKSNAIFGENAKAIEKWASGAASDFGQSKTAALDAAATFGNMFLQLGIEGGEATRMSKGMTELASDFASFHNADISEVISAQTAAFRGEYDAVQRFVPTINAAAVEQKALEMGLAGSTKELTAQHKALATEKLLMEGAGKAMGDFDRTNEGAANKMRIWGAKFEDFKAGVGSFLVPFALKGMSAVESFGKVIGGAFASGRADTNALDHLVGGVRAFIGAFKNASDGVTSSGFAGKMEEIAIVARRVVDVVREHWPEIQRIATQVFTAVSSIISGAVDIIMVIWNNFGSQIVNVIGIAWNLVRGIVEAAMNLIQGIIKVITGIIHGDWSQAWEGIKQIFGALWDAILAVLSAALGLMKEALSIAWEVVKAVITGAWDAIKSTISGAIENVVGWVTAMPGRIASAAVGMWDGIKSAFRSAINWIIGAWNGLDFKLPSFGGLKILGRTVIPGFEGPTLGTPNLPYLPYLASGGISTSDGWGIVGEDGPELRYLPRGAGVVPLPTSGGGGGQSLVVQLVMDGKVTAEQIIPHILVMQSRDPNLLVNR